LFATIGLMGLAVFAEAEAPANDDFANATALEGASGTISGNLLEATREVNERDVSGDELRGSVWYKWTANEGGLLNLAEGTYKISFGAVVGTSAVDFAVKANGRRTTVINVVAGEQIYIVATYESNHSADASGLFSFEWEFVPAPVVSIPTVEGEMAAGNTIEISVVGTGEGDLTYTWLRDGFQVPGWSDSPSWTIENLSPATAGDYQVVVSNRGGAARSNIVSVTGPGLGPKISRQPEGTIVTSGQSVSLSVEASGEGELSYQWRRHGLNLAGETSSRFEIGAAAITDTNIYDVVLSDAVFTRASKRVRITVEPERQIDHLHFRPDLEVRVEKRGGAVVGVVPASDGGFWVAGDFSRLGTEPAKQVIKISENGVRDRSFTMSETINGRIGGLGGIPDGRVWVWGEIVKGANGSFRGGARQYDATGQLLKVVNLSERGLDYLADAGVDAAGNLYTIGYRQFGEAQLLRVLSSGEIDSSYSPDRSRTAGLRRIAMVPTGEVFAWSETSICRFNATGGVDEAFSFEFGTWNNLLAISVGPDGEVAVVGTPETRNYALRQPIEWRIMSQTGDSFPARSGAVSLVGDQGYNAEITHVAFGELGTLLLSGLSATSRGHLWRLHSMDGISSAEELFYFEKSNPISSVQFYGPARNFVLGSNRQVLLGGNFNEVNGEPVGALLMRQADGNLSAVSDTVWTTGTVSAMVLQPSGKMVGAGDFSLVNGVPSDGMFRLNEDGTIDENFLFERSSVGPIKNLVADGTGRLLLGGDFTSTDGQRVLSRLRLSADGTVDGAFPAGGGHGRIDGLMALSGGGSISRWSSTFGDLAWYSESGERVKFREQDQAIVRSTVEQVEGSILVGMNHLGAGLYPSRGFLDLDSAMIRMRFDNSVDQFYGIGSRVTGSYRNIIVFPDESSLQDARFDRIKVDRNGVVNTKYAQNNWYGFNGFVSQAMGLDRLQLAGQVYVRWREPEATEFWQTRYWARINADGSVDDSAELEGLHEAVTAMVQRDDGNYYIATAGRVRLTEEIPPPVVLVQPTSQFVTEEENVELRIEAEGIGLTFQWRKNGVAIPGATEASLVLAAVDSGAQGGYDVAVKNGSGGVTSRLALVVVSSGTVDSAAGHHRLVKNMEGSGRISRIENTVAYSGELERLNWSVVLPEGWSVSPVLDAVTLAADLHPSMGSVELAEWIWTTVPSSGSVFYYTLTPPERLVGEVELAAMLETTRTEGQGMGLVAPDPLSVRARAEFHDADVDRDNRLNLSELLRVIELYNTRFGTTRTGRYRVAEGTVDGFYPDGTSNDAPNLLRHHLGDTDRDGQFSLSELLRVIELYNTRSGTTRTGAYRAALGSTDGFEAGE